jgi:MscS family membrane protein
MDNYLDKVFLDNTLRSYLISAAIIVGVYITRKLLSSATTWLLAKLVADKKRPWDLKKFRELVIAPIALFLTVLAVMIAFNRLKMPDVLNFTIYKASFHDIIESIARGILIGSFVWLCNRTIIFISGFLQQRASLTPDRTDDQLVIFFRDFLKVIVWIIGILLILKYSFGFDLSNVLTGLSIIGAAVALAFRESLENLIASFVIFFDKPFTIGDLVKVESVQGTVEKIGLRSTRIRTTEKTFVTVPNKKMVDSILDNQTLRTQRNVVTKIEVALTANLEELAKCIAAIEALLHVPEIIDFNAYLADTGQHAHIIHVEYFVTMDINIKTFLKLRENINLAIIDTIKKHRLELAGENVDVVVRR